MSSTSYNAQPERLPVQPRRSRPLVSLLGVWRAVSDWIQTAADHYAAATLYEELSRLSDAELRRRGLARETLARDVSKIGAIKGHPADAAE